MTCYDPDEMFADGEWLDATMCWLTAGGDPMLMILIPAMIYGVILMGLFIVQSSPLIPVILSIILSGVIFTTFPAGGTQLAAIAIMVVLAVAGVVLTWRFGR